MYNPLNDDFLKVVILRTRRRHTVLTQTLLRWCRIFGISIENDGDRFAVLMKGKRYIGLVRDF